AFLPETLAFSAATRLGNAALGRAQDWSGTALAQEFLSGALVLGGLKISTGLSGLALRRLGRPEGLGASLLHTVLPQLSQFGGILLGRRLEVAAGLRPGLAGATEITDAFATLLQFHVGGQLAEHAMGETWRRRETALDLRAETLASATAAPHDGGTRP